jgi:hypothetical protein
MLTTDCSGPRQLASPATENIAPSTIDQGSGLDTVPRSARSRGHARAVFHRAVGLRQRNAHRTGDEQIGQHGADHRPGAAAGPAAHQQGHAHEAGVGEGRHQRAKGRVLQAARSLLSDTAMVKKTISSADSRYRPSTTGLSSSTMGVLACQSGTAGRAAQSTARRR